MSLRSMRISHVRASISSPRALIGEHRDDPRPRRDTRRRGIRCPPVRRPRPDPALAQHHIPSESHHLSTSSGQVQSRKTASSDPWRLPGCHAAPDISRPRPAAPGVEPDTRWPYGAEGVGARAAADETRSEEAPAEVGGASICVASSQPRAAPSTRRITDNLRVSDLHERCAQAAFSLLPFGRSSPVHQVSRTEPRPPPEECCRSTRTPAPSHQRALNLGLLLPSVTPWIEPVED